MVSCRGAQFTDAGAPPPGLVLDCRKLFLTRVHTVCDQSRGLAVSYLAPRLTILAGGRMRGAASDWRRISA